MHRICCDVWSEEDDRSESNTSFAYAVVNAMLDSQMTDLRMTETVLVLRLEADYTPLGLQDPDYLLVENIEESFEESIREDPEEDLREDLEIVIEGPPNGEKFENNSQASNAEETERMLLPSKASLLRYENLFVCQFTFLKA